MRYGRTFPSEQQLIRLVRIVPFPATREEMVAAAIRGGFGPSLVLFLRLFDPDDKFENAVDFINRCEEVKLFLQEEAHTPKELLRSPQE